MGSPAARVKRLVCPCGAPVLVESPEPRPTPASHDGPVQPTVQPCASCGRLLVVEDPNVGRVVLGKWRLERRLGQGGMGAVYLATELSVERAVALKFLHPKLAEREEYRTRFEQEARIMGQVEHPNLAALFGVEREGAVPFLVMKYVKGKPLSRVMKERQRFTLDQALPLVVQMAAALSALHARGFVHRDLKPGNVIVSDEGVVTLLDFGLTRATDGALTRPGVALGSPQYMSPEQVMAGSLDGRSDLYTLGLLTSELLVGHRPYKDEDTKAMLLQHLHDVPEPAHHSNADVPEAVSQVLLKAMRKKPQERQPTVQAFVEELLAAARVRDVPLPRRETAEAMLAAVKLPARQEQTEVAEVISPETLSLSLSQRSLPATDVTEADLSPVRAPSQTLPEEVSLSQSAPVLAPTQRSIEPVVPSASAELPSHLKVLLAGLLVVLIVGAWLLLS